MSKASGEEVRRVPRIGKTFQVEVPDFSAVEPPQPTPGEKNSRSAAKRREYVDDKDDMSVGRLVWSPRGVEGALVDDYLGFVRTLFRERRHQLCEERALYFLKRCNYDVGAACELLQPQEPEEEPEAPAGGEAEQYEGDDFCMVCGDGGTLIVCDFEACKKVYHPACVGLEAVPSGTWICPRHTCHKGPKCKNTPMDDFRCIQCPTSYCNVHVPRTLKQSRDRHSVDFLCMDCLEKEVKFLIEEQEDNNNNSTNGSSSNNNKNGSSKISSHSNNNNSNNHKNRAKAHSSRSNGSSGGTKRGSKSSQKMQKPTVKQAIRSAFVRRVANLLKRQGKPLVQPTLGNKSVDLFKFYAEVVKNGGISNVVEDGRWRRVIAGLGVPSINNASEVLLYHYINTLYTYERLHFSGFMPLQDKSILANAKAFVVQGQSVPQSVQIDERHS
eukprot:CAMPEP_0197520596 /NCGR_PEP_ID=MMETSP1318-20131121/5939_1 /TAXON_ID=552666 /ORGANISM="Partenskyella glossopodia, Strain RCC365" /LENGTH=440 /DNA_ID=CAMNT_0043072253 /DNA_START=340 /DNA_END=1659 /DNA_ORIENTATION=-